jgi:hypothetical protein
MDAAFTGHWTGTAVALAVLYCWVYQGIFYCANSTQNGVARGVLLTSAVESGLKKWEVNVVGEGPQAQLVTRQLRDSLLYNTNSRIVKIAKRANVYTCGEPGTCSIYVIESGQVKVLSLSAEGRERIVASRSTLSICAIAGGGKNAGDWRGRRRRCRIVLAKPRRSRFNERHRI